MQKMALWQWIVTGLLLLYVGDGATDKIICRGQSAKLIFNATNYKSLIVKDPRGETIVHWKGEPDYCFGNCSQKWEYKCNKTDIEITLGQLTPEDSGNITMVESNGITVPPSYNIIISETVNLDKYCKFLSEGKLVCTGIQNLHNRAVKVLYANDTKLYRFENASFETPIAETGCFKVVLDADSECFHPYTFTVEAVQRKRICRRCLQSTSSGERAQTGNTGNQNTAPSATADATSLHMRAQTRNTNDPNRASSATDGSASTFLVKKDRLRRSQSEDTLPSSKRKLRVTSV